MTLASVHLSVTVRGGTMLLRRGWWRPAAYLLGRAIRLAPGDWEAHNNLAIALLKLERWEEAATIARRAMDLDPTAVESHDFLGIALLQLARWDEAVAVYRRALALDPDRSELYERLGMALLPLEGWEEVVEACEAAIRLAAGHYATHHRLGMAQRELGRWEGAAAAFRRAIELAAEHPAGTREVRGMRLSLDTATARLDAAAPGTAPRPGTSEHLERGVELLAGQRWDEAVAELADGSALSPDLGGLHFLQVDPLVRLGRFPEALAAHQRAVATGGAMPGLPGVLASARFRQRNAAFWSLENLGADVFALERWLEQLSAVQGPVFPGPRLLFVLDNDFGELTTVKYFTLGQRLAGRATLLLPQPLFVHNARAIPGRTFGYRSVDDILQAVDREQPELVFLCSGYLLCSHLQFTPDDLARLVDSLGERGCRVVTADPFLGLLSRHDPGTVVRFEISREQARTLAENADRPETVEDVARFKRDLDEQAWTVLRQAERILRGAAHLYPSHCDMAPDDVTETDARNVAFFNERLLRPVPPPAGTTRPQWLFILSSTDYDIQGVSEGEAGFADIVAGKLLETLAAGRHPILIGPRAFINRLMPRMPTSEGIDILSYCPFSRFMSLVLSAEQAFYWNLVSHSLLIRLYNQLPVIHFDRGHLVRTAPAIHDRIVRWYYQGWPPPLRDHRAPLTLDTVARWNAEYRPHAARLVERYRRAPSPEQMIANLMGRAAAPAVEAVAGLSQEQVA